MAPKFPEGFGFEFGSGLIDTTCLRCGAIIRVPLDDLSPEFISRMQKLMGRRP